MGSKDLHAKPFDEGTLAKLEIFEDYAQAWIPTFVMQKIPTICIFDFFAGTGYDKNGVQGSPIRILEKIRQHIGIIFQNRVRIKVFFNEFEPNKKEQKKFVLLKDSCDKYLDQNKAVGRAIDLELINEDFETLFAKMIDTITEHPSLVYLDQNGVKFLEDKYLMALENMNQTDFIYFVSSSYFKRFGNSEEFKHHFEANLEEINSNPYKFIHRIIIDQLRRKLPEASRLKLYPYTIRKGSNIYGIIFGAKHPRAVDKFLSIAWKRNETNGEANFDIDDEANLGQIDIFGNTRLSKIDRFKQNVEEKLLSEEICSNYDLLDFTFQEGHLPKHASDCIKFLKKEKKVDYDSSSPYVNYDNVYKKNNIVFYKVLKK